MFEFNAVLEILGINPFVSVPAEILNELFLKAGKDKSPIPVNGTVNTVKFKQNLVRYNGEWRFFINTTILKNSPKRIGETLRITIDYDPEKRSYPFHPRLKKALEQTPQAKQVFDRLPASRQLEIVRYIANIKTEESLERNIARAIQFLLGKGRFVGREKP